MAAFDFNQRPDFDGSAYDVVIVGAGAAGLLLASRLSATRRVLVLESGHFALDPDRQRLNEVVQEGKPLRLAKWGRKRAVGGTTLAWGGQSLPFLESDFEVRAWVPRSGWPIRRRDLVPHYQAANRAMGVDALDYDEEAFRLLRYAPPGFAPEVVRTHVSKWAPEPNFRKVFAREVEASFDVLYNCQVLGLDFSEGAVEGVRVSSFEGRRAHFSVPLLVLACGGLETVRTLLIAADQGAPLSEAQREVLGTAFMDHPCLRAGTIETSDPYRLQRLFATRLKRGRKYSVRLTASDAFVRRHRLLHLSASVMFTLEGGDFDPYQEVRDVRRLLARPGRLLAASGALARTGLALVRDGFLYKHGAEAYLSLMCEQAPTEDSRLRLHPTETDRFGLPRLAVQWAVSPETWRSAVTFCRALRDEFERLGLGHLRLRPEMEGGEDRTDLLSDVNHHMGGARMGTDPATSVVTPDLQVRGIPNLYVCSAAVYPTGSHSNPTLTLLALADRLACTLPR